MFDLAATWTILWVLIAGRRHPPFEFARILNQWDRDPYLDQIAPGDEYKLVEDNFYAVFL